MSDKRTVAIVTGASRGAGQGIARALGQHGCTVYVTGRTLNAGDHALGGTIGATAAMVTEAGGQGVAVKCDHSNPDDVKAFFAQVMEEQGRIDILVNNAAAVYDELSMPGGFWERPLKLGDMIDVGIRSSFDAAWYAAQAMVAQNNGLIVFTSGAGAEHYVFSPAYGAHKAAMDKMAFDMGMEFDHAGANVAAISVWMGAVMTERLRMVIDSDPAKFGALEAGSEEPEFTAILPGRCITIRSVRRAMARPSLAPSWRAITGSVALAGAIRRATAIPTVSSRALSRNSRRCGRADGYGDPPCSARSANAGSARPSGYSGMHQAHVARQRSLRR